MTCGSWFQPTVIFTADMIVCMASICRIPKSTLKKPFDEALPNSVVCALFKGMVRVMGVGVHLH